MNREDLCAKLLEAYAETRHFIQFANSGWIVVHPLSERIELPNLLECKASWEGIDPGVRGLFVLTDNTRWGEAYEYPRS